GGDWVGVWSAAAKRLRRFPGPTGWLAGSGLWTANGELRLPFVTASVPCGLARVPEEVDDFSDPSAASAMTMVPVPTPRPVPLQQAPCARTP
ncbi:hypothetical protein K6I33_004630, partial [Streptomyces sp. UNOB3_S3]|nr:hypothetical protein [Streptomyces sp. UNOB3_S3]